MRTRFLAVAALLLGALTGLAAIATIIPFYLIVPLVAAAPAPAHRRRSGAEAERAQEPGTGSGTGGRLETGWLSISGCKFESI